MNIIDRFLYKILILSFILLFAVVLEKNKVINLELIKNDLNQNFNVIKVVKTINGDFNIINLGDNIIEVDKNDHKITEINSNYYLYETIKKDVFSDILGSVTKIEKKDNKFNVYILDENNNLLVYSNLSSINVKIYQIIKVNDIIGEGEYIDNNDGKYLYCYYLRINEN